MKAKSKNIVRKVSMSDAFVDMTKHKHEMLLENNIDLDNRIITISGDIEEGWFDFVDARASLLEGINKKAITLRICSFGGDIYESLAVVGRIKSSPCKFIIEGYGKVMSAATLILACGWHRKLSKFSWFMHHAFLYDTGDKHMEIKDAVAQAEREMDSWCGFMGDFTKKDKEFWLAMMSSAYKDHYMSAKEALAYGVVDEII